MDRGIGGVGDNRSAADYWPRGEAWITGEVAARRKPPNV
jgi:hypothetical protein